MYISQSKWTKTTTRTSKRSNKQHLQYTTRTTQATTTTITTRAVTVRVRPHLLDPSAPLAAPRGARQWPYTNPRGARAYQKNPNCNAEWRSRILPPSQLGKSHGKTDSTINRLNSKWKICKQFGRIPTGVRGWKPPKMQKKPSDEHVSAFCGTHRSHVIEARIDILRKRFLYVVSKYERSTHGAYREKRLNVFFRAEIWKFLNSRISIDISAIRRCMENHL